ncbi:hypothetical protein E2C01_014134 [Portunus trituberculatus]|uniref:Uncharacterized protein n=1 Tax=Portunus trituberculatus TaxID=210409 RepID=A0A5B7DID1_PORTR|nr:hypothetical protein [Portunus trituberculatus]
MVTCSSLALPIPPSITGTQGDAAVEDAKEVMPGEDAPEDENVNSAQYNTTSVAEELGWSAPWLASVAFTKETRGDRNWRALKAKVQGGLCGIRKVDTVLCG